jgi:hypothetical protein
MTREEAAQVLERFRGGFRFSYSSYAAGTRQTFFFDREKGSFAILEQDAYSGDEHTSLVTEEELSTRLQRGFRLDEIS